VALATGGAGTIFVVSRRRAAAEAQLLCRAVPTLSMTVNSARSSTGELSSCSSD